MSQNSNEWLSASKKGLEKLARRRGVGFIVAELLQNAWDEDTTRVDVKIEAVPGRALAEITVTDDNPEGFKDLTHAYTLFAESNKKGDPSKRGRFNLGEKLVLALCERAEVKSTKGTVRFDDEGRTFSARSCTDKGTVFSAALKVRRFELDEIYATIDRLIPPIPTTINGRDLPIQTPTHVFEATLPTEISDEEGTLRRTRRKTEIRVYGNGMGQDGWIYEMGIPVCPTNDPWTVEVMQKVPLNMERDNVTPAYLQELRVLVLNETHHLMVPEALRSPAVAAALEADDVTPAAVKAAVTAKYGDKVMVADIKDREANNRAVANGFTVLPGSAFTGAQWTQIRRAGVVPVTTTQFATHGKSVAVDDLPEERITDGMRRIADLTTDIAHEILGVDVSVRFVSHAQGGYAACYGDRRLTFNVARLGYKWFNQPPQSEPVLDLIIHELAHELESNHLSDGYYGACTKLGARLTLLALRMPEIFTR